MIVTGASREEVEVVVRAVSATKYDGNVEIRDISDKSSRKTIRTSFTLRVKNGRAGNKGAHGTRAIDSRRTGNGPHRLRCSSMSACWHVHYDVLEALFSQTETVQVSSALATYTPGDFHTEAIKTAAMNVGSQMQPHYPTELCECTHWTDAETERAISGVRYSWNRREWLEQAVLRVVPPELDPLSAAAFRTAPRESELGKYASAGEYERELLQCSDCGCES
jgi:hypothetical protein